MRRSAAALACSFLLALGASSIPQPALATVPTTGSMALAVGIFNDPGTVVQTALWVTDHVIRLMDFVDDVFEHLKEDVRRARDPHRWPRVLPVRPPEISDPLPVRPAQ